MASSQISTRCLVAPRNPMKPRAMIVTAQELRRQDSPRSKEKSCKQWRYTKWIYMYVCVFNNQEKQNMTMNIFCIWILDGIGQAAREWVRLLWSKCRREHIYSLWVQWSVYFKRSSLGSLSQIYGGHHDDIMQGESFQSSGFVCENYVGQLLCSPFPSYILFR